MHHYTVIQNACRHDTCHHCVLLRKSNFRYLGSEMCLGLQTEAHSLPGTHLLLRKAKYSSPTLQRHL